VVVPDVAVTVTLNVPGGVPDTVVVGWGLPPQEAIPITIPKAKSSMPAKRKRLRVGTPRKTIPRNPIPVRAAMVWTFTVPAEAVVRAVVAMVSVVLVALPFGVNVAGLKEQLEADGNPEQAKLIVPLNPPCGVMEMLYAADCPAATVARPLGMLIW
jgi:hypothetical protein